MTDTVHQCFNLETGERLECTLSASCMRPLTPDQSLYCEEADILSYVKPEQDSGHAVTQIEAKVTQEA